MKDVSRVPIASVILALSLLASCSPHNPAGLATPTQQTIRSPSSGTTSPTNTLHLPPSATAHTAPATPAPLSEMGPWIVYSPDFHSILVTDVSGKPDDQLDVHGAITLAQGVSTRGLFAYVEQTPIPHLVIVALPSLSEKERIPLIDTSLPRPGGEDYASEVRSSVSLSPQWSPNGRYLAFSASLDGPSADLYVYDAESRKISRTTAGPNQVGRIWWSPHSDWIVHEEIETFFGWVVASVWAARPDGSETKWLYTPRSHTNQEILAWVSPARFISYTHGIVWGDCDIRLVNLEFREVTLLFSGCTQQVPASFAVDPVSGTVAFVPAIWKAYVSEEELMATPFPTSAVYTISLSLTQPALMVDGAYQVTWDPLAKQFSTNEPCPTDPALFVSFEPNGTKSCLPFRNVLPSPDGQYIAVSDPALSVYTSSGDLLAEPTSLATSWDLAWAPDSRGLLVESAGTLNYVAVPSLLATPMNNGPPLRKGEFGWAYKRP